MTVKAALFPLCYYTAQALFTPVHSHCIVLGSQHIFPWEYLWQMLKRWSLRTFWLCKLCLRWLGVKQAGAKLQLQQTSARDTCTWVYFCFLQIHPDINSKYCRVIVRANGGKWLDESVSHLLCSPAVSLMFLTFLSSFKTMWLKLVSIILL